ncbi:hypothetical protein CROQUDRAFT_16970, partial [Cronartium quercuum f. sp. fusiforme G11]
VTTETTSSGILPLEQDNFHQWKGAMFSYFLEHNLDGIVDGIEAKPDTTHPVKLANWLLREKKAARFISQKLDSCNRDLLVNEENQRDPHALWTSINKEYASKKSHNQSRLFACFLNLNCLDGDLDWYIMSFQQIIKEMGNAGTTCTVMIASAEASDTPLTLCLNGKHNPKTSHPKSECFQLHPEK